MPSSKYRDPVSDEFGWVHEELVEPAAEADPGVNDGV
jgi:hypothetical protein